MLSHSRRLIRSAANRVDDQRVASRLRRMAGRRRRAERVLSARLGRRPDGPVPEVPGTDHLLSLASPAARTVLDACRDHQRMLLHELNAELDHDLERPLRTRLRRTRDGVERDVARLRAVARGMPDTVGDAAPTRVVPMKGWT